MAPRPPVRRLLLLPLLVLACSPVAARRGGTVIMASGADLQSPNPLLTVHPLARQVQRYVLLVTLVRYDSALAPGPSRARRWDWSRDSTALTLHLFAGLRWHDGAPTTARDAAWTLDAARDPVTGYPRQSDLAGLAAVSAPDDTTLSLRFARPQAGIPDVLTDLAILPRHLLDSVPLGQLRRAAWNQHPVGNGPFRFVAHEPNRRWIFSANPDFPAPLGGRPRLDRFVIAVVDEPTTKLAALTSGELDFAGINSAHAEYVRRDPRLAVLDYPLLFTYALVLNLRRPPFDQLAARQLVASAIDRRAIVDGVLFGFGTPATGPVPPQLSGTEGRNDGTEGETGPPPPTFRPAVLPSRPLRFEMLTVGSGEGALEQMLQAQPAPAGGPPHDPPARAHALAGPGAGAVARLRRRGHGRPGRPRARPPRPTPRAFRFAPGRRPRETSPTLPGFAARGLSLSCPGRTGNESPGAGRDHGSPGRAGDDFPVDSERRTVTGGRVFRASAPVRSDFAGGWTDVAPFAERERGVVGAGAIELRSRAEVRPGGERYHLCSEDLGESVELCGDDTLAPDGRLDLLKAGVRRSGLGPCALRTWSDAPPGSGLGSSGALDVALVAALDAALGRTHPAAAVAAEAFQIGRE